MTLECHVRYTMLVIFLVAAVSGLPLPDLGLAAEQSPFYQGKIVAAVVGTAPAPVSTQARGGSCVTGANIFPATRKSSLKTSPAPRLWWRPTTFFKPSPTGSLHRDLHRRHRLRDGC